MQRCALAMENRSGQHEACVASVTKAWLRGVCEAVRRARMLAVLYSTFPGLLPPL